MDQVLMTDLIFTPKVSFSYVFLWWSLIWDIEIVDTLNKAGAKGTFFVNGNNCKFSIFHLYFLLM